jgi:hypothetical protein
MPTQITKSETFAVNFLAFFTMQIALQEAEKQPAGTREKMIQAILETVHNHPTPAEA